MSIPAYKHVWESSKASGSALVVLLALADYSDNCGLSWPTVKTLAAKTRMSIRNVQHHLGQLKKTGEILVMDGDNYWSANRYQIVGLQGAGAADGKGQVQPIAPTGAAVSTGGGAADDTHKNPSIINHQMNPPLEPQTTTPAPEVVVVVSSHPTSFESVQDFKTETPERRPSLADDEGTDDFTETADLPPSSPAPIPQVPAHPLAPPDGWREFFKTATDWQLCELERQFGANRVNDWVEQAKTMKLGNPGGFVVTRLKGGLFAPPKRLEPGSPEYWADYLARHPEINH